MRTATLGSALFFCSAQAFASSSIAPGLSYDSSNGYHVVVANLDSSQVDVRVAMPFPTARENLLTVAQWAKSESAYVAINANYFGGPQNFPCGAARGHGVQHPAIYAEAGNCVTTLGWARAKGAVFNSAGHEADPKYASQYTELATGGGLLLQNGQRRDWNHVKLEERRGCTAVGISADRRKLIFVVTDNRACTGKGLQDVLLANGAADAIHLDGGGSSKMWIRGKGYVNNEREDRRPSVAIVARPGAGACAGIWTCDPSSLRQRVRCLNGVTTKQACLGGCLPNPRGATCVPGCPSGDGLYCGNNGIPGDPGTLYSCSQGAVVGSTKCPKKCVYMPAGIEDRCQ